MLCLILNNIHKSNHHLSLSLSLYSLFPKFLLWHPFHIYKQSERASVRVWHAQRTLAWLFWAFYSFLTGPWPEFIRIRDSRDFFFPTWNHFLFLILLFEFTLFCMALVLDQKPCYFHALIHKTRAIKILKQVKYSKISNGFNTCPLDK